MRNQVKARHRRIAEREKFFTDGEIVHAVKAVGERPLERLAASEPPATAAGTVASRIAAARILMGPP